MPGSRLSNGAAEAASPPPAIDVLVPHFNDVAGLAMSLASVDAQDWPGGCRIVVADDGSGREAKAELAALLERRASPVVFVDNGTNRGRPYTRNRLLDAIESPYVAWLDSGDEWYPGKLSAQMAAAESLGGLAGPSPYWITCNFDWQWSGRPAEPRYQVTDQDQVMALLRGKDLRAYLWTVLGPAETFRNVGRFDSTLPRLQDLDFFLRFMLKGGFLHMPRTAESLCVYHKSDVGRDADEIRACHTRLFDKHRVLYTRYGPKFSRVQLYNMEIHAARFAANNNDAAKRRRYLARAFRHRPKQFVRRLLRGGLPR